MVGTGELLARRAGPQRAGELAPGGRRDTRPSLERNPGHPDDCHHAKTTDATVSFDVGRLGSPVLVKVPYFPNWHASGALGPYPVSPNLMAVVPTAHHVVLTYGTTPADQIGKLASLGGVVGLGMLMTLRPPVMSGPSAPEPVPASSDENDEEGTAPAEVEDGSEEGALVEGSFGPPYPSEETEQEEDLIHSSDS